MIIDRPLFTCSICCFHKKEERVVKMLILLGVQALSKVTSTGAMTYCFIQAIERGQATTYGNMLNAMRAAIRDTDTSVGGGVVTTLLSMLLTGGSGVGLRQVFSFLHVVTSLSYNKCLMFYFIE